MENAMTVDNAQRQHRNVHGGKRLFVLNGFAHGLRSVDSG